VRRPSAAGDTSLSHSNLSTCSFIGSETVLAVSGLAAHARLRGPQPEATTPGPPG